MCECVLCAHDSSCVALTDSALAALGTVHNDHTPLTRTLELLEYIRMGGGVRDIPSPIRLQDHPLHGWLKEGPDLCMRRWW